MTSTPDKQDEADDDRTPRPRVVTLASAAARGAAAAAVPCSTSDGLIWYARTQKLLLVATAAPAYSDASVRECFDALDALAQRFGLASSIFVYNPRAAPTAAQRQMSVGAIEKTGMADRVAMLTDSVLARGALTALAWFVPRKSMLKPFPSKDMTPALEWLAETRAFQLDVAKRLAREVITAAHASVDQRRVARP